MALTWLHKFHSPKADGIDSTLVKPSNWNEQHDAKTDLDGVLLGRLPGSGPGDIQDLPMASAVTAILPPGLIMAYAMDSTPAGWLLCRGQSVLRADYLNLYNVILTTYGSVDSAHFTLPDLRGRVIAALDAGVGRLTGSTISNPNVVNGAGGAEARSASWPCYGYVDVSASIGYGGVGVHYNGPFAAAGAGEGAGNQFVYSGTGVATDAFTVNSAGTIRNDGNNRAGGSVITVQPTLMLNYLIKT